MIYYELEPTTRYYYELSDVENPIYNIKKEIPWNFSRNRLGSDPVKCDILSYDDMRHPIMKVRMYFTNETIEGYLFYIPTFPLRILNKHELFDGRFNLAEKIDKLEPPKSYII